MEVASSVFRRDSALFSSKSDFVIATKLLTHIEFELNDVAVLHDVVLALLAVLAQTLEVRLRWNRPVSRGGREI